MAFRPVGKAGVLPIPTRRYTNAHLSINKAPIVLTVNGKATAVVQDAEGYQQLLDKIELLESIVGIRKSIEEFEQGKGIPLKQAFSELREKYGLPD